MFEKFIEKRQIKLLDHMCNSVYDGLRICEATLYEIEHDLLPDFMKESAIKQYGSMETYKAIYENKLKEFQESYEKGVKKLTDHKIRLYELKKK